MNDSGVSPGASAATLTSMVATIELPMMGARRSLISGSCWSRSITGAAIRPTTGMLIRNWSKPVVSRIRTENCSVPFAPPASSQVAYGRIV